MSCVGSRLLGNDLCRARVRTADSTESNLASHHASPTAHPSSVRRVATIVQWPFLVGHAALSQLDLAWRMKKRFHGKSARADEVDENGHVMQSATYLSTLRHATHELRRVRAVEPTQPPLLRCRIDPHHVTPRAEHEPARARSIDEQSPVAIEPCEPAVERSHFAGCLHALRPLVRNDLPALVHAAVQQQLADTRLVARADFYATTPVRAAGNGQR